VFAWGVDEHRDSVGLEDVADGRFSTSWRVGDGDLRAGFDSRGERVVGGGVVE
jgi:hypothetical protein